MGFDRGTCDIWLTLYMHVYMYVCHCTCMCTCKEQPLMAHNLRVECPITKLEDEFFQLSY